MTEQIRQFIDQIAAGENAEAKEGIENILSAKAFEALDTYKQNIAQGIFGGQEESETTETEVEVQDPE